MKTLIRHGLVLSLLLLGAASASALTLSLNDCDLQGCAGSDVKLDVNQVNANTWNITLTLDSTGYTRGDQEDGVVQAGFKAIGGVSAVSFDSSNPFSDGAWADPKLAGINGNGGPLCDGPGEADFICSSGYANIETNKVYTWNFIVQGSTQLDINDWAIKFQYCDSTDSDCKGQLLSAHLESESPAVPEPSAALVFAGGLLAAATQLRRRR